MSDAERMIEDLAAVSGITKGEAARLLAEALAAETEHLRRFGPRPTELGDACHLAALRAIDRQNAKETS